VATETLAAEGRAVRVGGFALEKKDGATEQVGYQFQPYPVVAR
jgi:hypothetical protein